MTEAKQTAADKKAEKKDEKAEGGDITYEDHGDYVLEIDNRGPDEVRRQLPKALKDVPVDKATHEELTERLEIEKQAVENEGGDPDSVTWEVPPLKEDKGKDDKPETITVTSEGREKS
jgi:hypothetical protein